VDCLIRMDISADGGSYGVDFQKQSGPRHIVNIKGPFFQRGSADPGSDQQKEQQTQSSFPNISNDHSERQGNTIGRKSSPRPVGDEQKISLENSSSSRHRQSISSNQHVLHSAKHLVDEVEDEEEEDDSEMDASICVSNNEQTGRWTRKEHEVFLEALKKFGKVTIGLSHRSLDQIEKLVEKSNTVSIIALLNTEYPFSVSN
jgi:hypothetical protein